MHSAACGGKKRLNQNRASPAARDGGPLDSIQLDAIISKAGVEGFGRNAVQKEGRLKFPGAACLGKPSPGGGPGEG
eukprot:7676906-Pyramimonas_sp.AAC.1